MIEDTEAYYRRRWKEELAAAEQAINPNAADAHRSLAARYLVLSGEPQVRSLDKQQRPNIAVSQGMANVGANVG